MAVEHLYPVSGIALVLTLLTACGRDSAPVQEPEVPTISVTRWAGKTELFAEYPPLVTGEVSRFAIHLTRIADFKAVIEGEVIVELQSNGRVLETFRTDKPSRPGIFGVDVRPTQAGKRDLVITLRSSSLTDEQPAGQVEVFNDCTAAVKNAEAI